jgi:hypothetical protein
LATTEKTEEPVTVPVHPDLAAVLVGTPSKHLTFLVTEYGRPFTAAGFGGWFRDRCDGRSHWRSCPGRPSGEPWPFLTHVRSIAAVRLQVYTKDADRRRMARDAMAAITRTKTGNGAERVAKSAKKS